MGPGDAQLAPVGGASGRDVATAEIDGAGVRRERARQDVQQGGLAGAVRPDDADRLARGEREVDAVQHGECAETLANVNGGENRRVHG